MKSKKKEVTDFIARLYRIVNKVNELEKKPRAFDGDELLHPSEIHTIQAVGDHAGINVTSLAGRLGISKPGVSKMINKLRKRGFINKVRSMENDKEVLLVLTEKGKTVYDGHEKFHAEMYFAIVHHIGDIKPDQINSFLEILAKVEDCIELYLGN